MSLAFLMAVTFTARGQAQEPSSVVLLSGQWFHTDIMGLEAGGLAVRTKGQAGLIPLKDVAVIQFDAAAARVMTPVDAAAIKPCSTDDGQWAITKPGEHILWLVNQKLESREVRGQLSAISGASPLNITFTTSSGARQFSSNEIVRIILERPAKDTCSSPRQPE
ncbi:MAG: hypothetical protein ABI603_10545 [Acidobacteriota bacterium]